MRDGLIFPISVTLLLTARVEYSVTELLPIFKPGDHNIVVGQLC